jgi:hypothetical protein
MRKNKDFIREMKKSIEDIKNNVPMRVTEYSTDEKGNTVRIVSMKRPSEIMRKK